MMEKRVVIVVCFVLFVAVLLIGIQTEKGDLIAKLTGRATATDTGLVSLTVIDDGVNYWGSIIPPEGIFEPTNYSLSGTHVSTFSIRFSDLKIENTEEVECFVKLPDNSIKEINATGLSLDYEDYNLSYVVKASDSIVFDDDVAYIPWILKNCSLINDSGIKFNETVNSRIYVHDYSYWEDAEITRAVTCASTPGVYFNNTGKCEFAEDTMFALRMRNGNSVNESCFNNPGVSCSDSLCNGIYFPTCDAISYFAGYDADVDDPNNYATFSASFADYTTPVAYTMYTNSSGNFKLRLKQALIAKTFSVTINNLTIKFII